MEILHGCCFNTGWQLRVFLPDSVECGAVVFTQELATTTGKT